MVDLVAGLLFRDQERLEKCAETVKKVFQYIKVPFSSTHKQTKVEAGKYDIKDHLANDIGLLLESHKSLRISEHSYAIWKSDTYTA